MNDNITSVELVWERADALRRISFVSMTFTILALSSLTRCVTRLGTLYRVTGSLRTNNMESSGASASSSMPAGASPEPSAPKWVARSAPDGYTWMMLTSQLLVASNVYRDLKFDLARDFASISLI